MCQFTVFLLPSREKVARASETDEGAGGGLAKASYPTPLIPAKAGIQIEWRSQQVMQEQGAPNTRPERLTIWIPAFAGMSG